jgi:tRNA A-37 threonylcarbamoyl transferase component Bud32
MTRSECPGDGELLALHNGELAAEDLESVCTHLSVCERCEARLIAIQNADAGIISNLQHFLGHEPRSDSTACRVLEERAKFIRPTTASGDRAADRTRTHHASKPASADEFDLLTGIQTPFILGKYELMREIGRGGMGVVFTAIHKNLNKPVAVKVINPEHADRPLVVARFRREARALGELAHPNIVTATDADEAGGIHFLVMELIDGSDLASILRRSGPLPLADCCEVVRQAATGLQYVHERGRVHRDLKPSNLMLSRDGVVKILDLGLAALRSTDAPSGALTVTFQVMGTPDYMAPEQWTDTRAADIRADIYSLGCTLYHLLTGRAPFAVPEHEGVARKQLAHEDTTPTPVTSLRPELPAELEVILVRMLAKRPDDRFATPQYVADALVPYCTGANCRALVAVVPAEGGHAGLAETASHPGPTLTAPYTPPARGRKWLGAAVAVAFVLLAAGMAWWALSSDPKPTEELQPQPKPEEPTPKTVTPPVPEDKGPQPGEWYSVSRRMPVRLVWDDPQHTFLDFNAAKRELRLDVPTFAFVGLGRTEYAGYTINMPVQQTRWTGGVGVFFGYRDTVLEGRPCKTCQVLELRANPGGGARFALQRLRATVAQSVNGPILLQQIEMASADLTPPTTPRQHTLRVDVNADRLVEVQWDGKPLPALVKRTVDEAYNLKQADYIGDFGVFMRKSNAVLGDTELMIYERSKP